MVPSVLEKIKLDTDLAGAELLRLAVRAVYTGQRRLFCEPRVLGAPKCGVECLLGDDGRACVCVCVCVCVCGDEGCQ